MAIIYKIETNNLGLEYITMFDSEKPDCISYIPNNPDNSDYQRYLKSLEENK